MNARSVRGGVGSGLMLCSLAALAVAPLLAGCESSATGGGESGPGSTPRAVQHPTLEGVPLPAGFQLVDDRSFFVSSGQLRHANCEFTGNASPATVTRFYEQHMPSSGFTLRQKRFDRGEYVLEFDGNAERSTVRIKRHKFKTVVIVDLSPTPRGPVERDKKHSKQQP